MKERIKDIAKRKGYTLDDIAKEMGIIYNALYQRLNVSPKLSTLQQIADILGCEVVEFIPLGDGYYHSYDENGEWQGVLKRPTN